MSHESFEDEFERAVRDLPREIAPPRDLWPAVRDRLPAHTAPRARIVRLRPRLWAAAAAAAACIALVWTGRGLLLPADRTASGPGRDADPFPRLVSGLERECMGAGRSLQASLQAPADALPPELGALGDAIGAAVTTLDVSIAEARDALAADPGNPVLEKLLLQRYEQKLALLHDALLRVSEV